MSYKIAGIDVHKKMLAVVVSDVEIESEYQFERRMFGGNPEQLRLLAAWLPEQEAEEVVMESTAQYWKPVWGTLERYWKPIREKREGAKRRSGTLHLAQAQSNCGRRGRKKDFIDAERLVKRLVARELTLSFVPDAGQRLWRAVTRKKYQLRTRPGAVKTTNCLGHNQAIGAIAHRQCRLIWLILHQGVRYEEPGPAVNKQSKQRRTTRMIRQLRSLGYRIEPPNPQHPSPAQVQ